MHAISIKFSGSGNNKVLFNDLTSIQKFSGNFRIEVLNGGTIEIGRFLFVNSSVLIHAAHANIKIGEDVMFACICGGSCMAGVGNNLICRKCNRNRKCDRSR